MHKICLALFFFGAVALSQDAAQFCQNGPPGKYCTADLSGYYECTGQAAYRFQCPAGTECACFVGPSCSSVELVGSGSPCQLVETLPLFPILLSVALNSTVSDSDRLGTTTRSEYFQLYLDRLFGRFRDDKVTPNRTNILNSDYYYGNSSNNLHYAFDATQGTCTADYQPVPFFGIPNGYRFYNTSTYNGQAVNIYYFRAGGQNNGEDTTYAYYITTQPDSNGFVVPILNYGFLNSPQRFASRRINNTYSYPVVGPSEGFPSFPASYFNPPALCLIASPDNSTSGSVPSSSGGSASAGESSSTVDPTSSDGSSTSGGSSVEYCENTGFMRCAGGTDNQYQVCDHGFWQQKQTCQAGLKCEVSGNYIYCV